MTTTYDVFVEGPPVVFSTLRGDALCRHCDVIDAS